MGYSSDAASFHQSSSVSASPTSSPTSSPPPPPPPQAQGGAAAAAQVIHSPCAACKILRRRCADKCILAPYFPPTEPLKFTTAHRVFGASNIIKLLQDLPESQRADAVSSMVYEANARIRDPVYGCAGAICHLQKQVNELQAQLARAQAELIHLQAQNKNLVALICMEVAQMQQQQQHLYLHSHCAFGGGGDSSSPQPSPTTHGGALADHDAAFFLDDVGVIGQQGHLLEELVPLWI